MFTKHYSQMEMDQWHRAACTTAPAQADTTPRTPATRTAKGQGQGERNATSQALPAMSAMPSQVSDVWASECLFDCYNG